MPKIYHTLNIAQIQQWIEDDGLQQWKVAERLGVSLATIGRLCKRYRFQTKRTGPRSGELHPGWTGGHVFDGTYWLCYMPEHPHARQNGYVLEHRLVMEDILGRYLDAEEVVHHKDKDTQNNHPENLEVFATNAEHLRHELAGQCPQWSAAGKQALQHTIEKIAIRRRLARDARQSTQTTVHQPMSPGSTDASQPS